MPPTSHPYGLRPSLSFPHRFAAGCPPVQPSRPTFRATTGLWTPVGRGMGPRRSTPTFHQHRNQCAAAGFTRAFGPTPPAATVSRALHPGHRSPIPINSKEESPCRPNLKNSRHSGGMTPCAGLKPESSTNSGTAPARLRLLRMAARPQFASNRLCPVALRRGPLRLGGQGRPIFPGEREMAPGDRTRASEESLPGAQDLDRHYGPARFRR